MMKKAFVSVVILAAFFSCSIEKQDIPKDGAVIENELVIITATQESGPWTRTVLDEDLIHVLWTPEDEINLFYQDQSAHFTSINTEENTAVAQFKGQMTVDIVTAGNEDGEMESSYFWGLYPYSEDARYDMDNGTIETSLPWEQTAEKNSFADDLFITIGRSTSWSMPFYNVCSGLRFTVDQEGITAITLRSNGNEPLAGRFVATFDEETERPVVKDVRETYTEIRLVPPEGSPCFYPDTYYYFVTLPGTLESGFTLELEGLPNDAKVSTANPVTFKRSRFLSTDLTAERYYADILPLESIDLNIENKGVQAYLQEVDYSDDLVNYNNSYIRDYVSMGTDEPEPVRFNWKNTGSRTITVSDPDDGHVVFYGDASDQTTEIYNLIPGKKYLYHVEGDFSWDSTFTPEGTLRMIRVDGVRNVRDLGGWKADGGTIRYGRLYRGAQLDDITDNGRSTLSDLQVSADIDLRGGNSNTLGMDDYYSYSVQYFEISGSSGSLYAEAIRRIVRLLSEDKAVYFHCMVGADRTGTLAFLMEAMLGVSESDLSKDFELTSFYQTRTRNGQGNSQFALKKLKSALNSYSGNNIQEKVLSWADQIGLETEVIEQLKSLMLE